MARQPVGVMAMSSNNIQGQTTIGAVHMGMIGAPSSGWLCLLSLSIAAAFIQSLAQICIIEDDSLS